MVLAGGLGTRLGDLTKSLPKAMMEVEGRPFLEHELTLLRGSGVKDFVFCVGYLGDIIEDHFGDGHRFGVSIRYTSDWPEMLGPAGALRKAGPLLKKDFFVTYADAYLQIDYARLMEHLRETVALGLMAVYRNRDAYGRSDIEVRDGHVVRYDKGGGDGMEWINFGVTALRRDALGFIPSSGPCDEERFYGEMIARGQLLAHRVRRRFYEIGTPASLAEFRRFIRTRQVTCRS